MFEMSLKQLWRLAFLPSSCLCPSSNSSGERSDYAQRIPSWWRHDGRGQKAWFVCSKGVDLNRDFPDPIHRGSLGLAPNGSEQAETTGLIKWMQKRPFVASASFHEVNHLCLSLSFSDLRMALVCCNSHCKGSMGDHLLPNHDEAWTS